MNVLVVTTLANPQDALREHISDGDTVKVVVPAVRQGVLGWLANDQRAFTAAEKTAEAAFDRLPGDVVEARPGEADVELAIRDALATFPADEILVALRPEEDAGTVETLAARSTPGHEIDGVRVRTIVVGER